MKYLSFLLLTLSLLLHADEFLENVTMSGNIQNTTQLYLQAPKDKHNKNNTLSTNLEFGYSKDAFSLKTEIKAVGDFYDLSKKSERNERSYLRLDELYGSYDFSDDQILIGKNIRFWGALEVRNITDGFNNSELRDDPFNADKIGSWNASYTHYTESGEFSLIVKLYEESRDMPAYPYVYYYFPKSVPLSATTTLPLVYNSKLKTESGATRPSLYLKYSGSTESEYALDYAVVFENGYDSQRYYTTTLSSNAQEILSSENAYLVNKVSTFDTLVVGATLYKLEALYADVIDDAEISDYYHIGLGVEQTITQIYGDADLGLLSEYYYYGVLDKSKRDDLALFEIFQNDLFLGARYSFNQGNDATILGGVIIDMEYKEEVYYVEYESRIGDSFKISCDYRYIEPSRESLTAFHLMGKHERLSLDIGYYF